MIALLVGYEYALAAYCVFLNPSTLHIVLLREPGTSPIHFFPYKCRIMNKLEVLELTGGSVMLSKYYISFASWTVPMTKMKEVDTLP